MVLFSDLEFSDLPTCKDTVRAKIITGGVILRSIKDTPAHTRVTIINHSDIKLSLPSWVASQVFQMQGRNLANLEKYITKLKKEGEAIDPPYPFLDDFLYED